MNTKNSSRLRMQPWRVKPNGISRRTYILSLSGFSGLIATVLILLLLWDTFSRLLVANTLFQSKSRCDILFLSSIHEIQSLRELDLSNCNLTHVPATIRYASNLFKLDLSHNPFLHTLPTELRFCTNLDTLFVSNCIGIRDSLPSVLGKMPSITRLGWKSGSLSNLDDYPESIPPNLIHLILTNNKIQSIQNIQVFKRLNKVRKLMLSHNQLQVLNGIGVAQLQQLELLRLGGNTGLAINGNSLPTELWTLPKLKWLTLPMDHETRLQVVNQSHIPTIALSQLHSLNGKHILGNGASGKVTAYSWNGQQVAVKRIHGVTSDGTAEDELTMYAAVESIDIDHHRLVGCLALFYDGDCFHGKDDNLALLLQTTSGSDPHPSTNAKRKNPQCNKGIVMKRLPNNLIDLALPPTINEVTRDRYENRSFTSTFVYNVLKDIATALVYLHEYSGIAHGDLYAHNIKVDPTGRAYLLDLGASYSFSLHPQFMNEAKMFETRAYCLLSQELIERVQGTTKPYSTLFTHLLDECVKPEPKISFSTLF